MVPMTFTGGTVSVTGRAGALGLLRQAKRVFWGWANGSRRMHVCPSLRKGSTTHGAGVTPTRPLRKPHRIISKELSLWQRPSASEGPRARPVGRANLPFLSLSCSILKEQDGIKFPLPLKRKGGRRKNEAEIGLG